MSVWAEILRQVSGGNPASDHQLNLGAFLPSSIGAVRFHPNTACTPTKLKRVKRGCCGRFPNRFLSLSHGAVSVAGSAEERGATRAQMLRHAHA